MAMTMNQSETPQEFRRGHDDETGPLLHESRKYKDPEICPGADDLIEFESPPSQPKKSALNERRATVGDKVLRELHLQGDRFPVIC